MDEQSSSRTRRVLIIVLAIAILLLVVAAGILLGRQLAGGKPAAENVVLPTATVQMVQPTVAPSAQASEATGSQATAQPRAAVPGSRVDAPTGIAILPPVLLTGGRRYVLQVSSATGAVNFSGSTTRGSIDPKIALDVMREIKGTTPWEQEVEPPAPDARTWTLGVTASAVPVGKDLQIVILDVGPK
jgi:hypothetical protein